MTAYADYEYYANKFVGTDIPSDSFDKMALEASRKVNYYTMNRIKDNIQVEVKDATCSIAELLYEQHQLKEKILTNNQKEIASETVGPHSRTYVNNTALQDKRILNEKELNQNIYYICLEFLQSTGLMYRGI